MAKRLCKFCGFPIRENVAHALDIEASGKGFCCYRCLQDWVAAKEKEKQEAK